MSLLKRIILLLVLIGTASTSAQSADLVQLNDHTESITVSTQLEVFVDPSRTLDIEQVSSTYARHFTPNTAGTTNFGYSEANWWLRFQLRSETHQTWYLFNDLPVGGDMELFILAQDGQMNRQHLQYKRLDQQRTPTWKLNLPPGETVNVYLRANNGQYILRLPIKLMNDETFIRYSDGQYTFFAMILAGLAVLMLYNLLLMVSLKEPSYLSMVGVIAALLIIFYRDANLFPALAFLNDTTAWHQSTVIVFGTLAGFHYWRIINRGGSQTLEYLLKILQWLALAALPIVGFLQNGVQISLMVVVILTPIVMVISARTALQGHRPTRSTYWALLFILMSILICILPHSSLPLRLPAGSLYIGQAGTLIGILLLSLNHAERDRLLREQTEKAEAARKAAHDFLTTMSHELRTPMHAVQGLGELLQNTRPTPEQDNYLHKLLIASRHMSNLVDNILDLAKLENGSPQQPGNAPFQLETLLAELDALFSIPARQKNLALIMVAHTHTQHTLYGDGQSLRQILINLLGNAIKFTDSGQVKLTVSGSETDNEHSLRLQIEVSDTGIGISAEQQAKLFQPFYQVDASRTRQRGGSGLGLAISRKLVERMGGKLQLISALQRGSRFFFSLTFAINSVTPELQNSQNRQSKDTPCPPPPNTCADKTLLTPLWVLVVDDDPMNRLVAEKFLETRHIRVTAVSSGSAALRAMQQTSHRFDLVFMDVSMPEMDGYETTRRIRAHEHFRTLPIIALTAHAIAGEAERCQAAGMNDCLTKPYKLEELLGMLQRHTG